MSGLLQNDKGDIIVNNRSIRYNLDEIRSNLGVCPQHDILWDELTAREHLQIFAEFKGVSRKDIKREINERLQDVDLFYVGNNLSQTFSGGMKRRLSCAIACIGDPSVIILDEPTTGMDPHSRRKVWELIRKIKKNKVILLTTHSMEEADALSDRIGIMAYGQLRCVGDSLHLKTKYGTGYNLHIVLELENEEKFMSLLHKYFPDLLPAQNDAGNMIFNISQDVMLKLTELIEELESLGQGDGSLVKDWSISHTTLEEVYYKVTKKEYVAFEEIEKKKELMNSVNGNNNNSTKKIKNQKNC